MDEVNSRIMAGKVQKQSDWVLSDQFSFDIQRPQTCPGAAGTVSHFVKEHIQTAPSIKPTHTSGNWSLLQQDGDQQHHFACDTWV